MQANGNSTNIENAFLMLSQGRTGPRRRAREKSAAPARSSLPNREGTSKDLPPSFGSASTVFPSLEKKVTAPVAASTLTVMALVESLISFFTDDDLKVLSFARLRDDRDFRGGNFGSWTGHDVYDAIATGLNPHGSGRGLEGDAVRIPMGCFNGEL